MSTYIERYCPTHLEWDDDTDNPAEACPECIKEGLFIPRAKLESELSAIRAERDALRKALSDLVFEGDRGAWYVSFHDSTDVSRFLPESFKLAPRGPEGEG